jgi:transposase
VDLSIEETAKEFGVSTNTVSSLIHSGELEAYSASRSPNSKKPRLRTSDAALAAFKAKRAVTPAIAPIRRRRRHGEESDVIHFFS